MVAGDRNLVLTFLPQGLESPLSTFYMAWAIIIFSSRKEAWTWEEATPVLSFEHFCFCFVSFLGWTRASWEGEVFGVPIWKNTSSTEIKESGELWLGTSKYPTNNICLAMDIVDIINISIHACIWLSVGFSVKYSYVVLRIYFKTWQAYGEKADDRWGKISRVPRLYFKVCVLAITCSGIIFPLDSKTLYPVTSEKWYRATCSSN